MVAKRRGHTQTPLQRSTTRRCFFNYGRLIAYQNGILSISNDETTTASEQLELYNVYRDLKRITDDWNKGDN